MKTIFRLVILIAMLFGIVVLAKNQVAWAADSAEKSISLQIEESVSQDKSDYCEMSWRKYTNDCKVTNKDKDKDKCKKHPEKCGTVKPPPQQVIIQKSGEYSVGGFCTLSVVLNDPTVYLDVRIQTLLPANLPDNVQKVRQGCLLTYYSSTRRIDELPTDSGSTTICFAAIPGKQMTLYFYNLYLPKPEWVALDTTINTGKACASGNKSGVYVATFSKP